MTVPQGFDAYARMFFPFVGATVTESGEVHEQHMTWKEMALKNGRIAHGLMEEETIVQGADSQDGRRPSYSVTTERFNALLPILGRHTSSSSGWFLLWDGFGDLDTAAFNHGVPKVKHDARDFYLLRGSLGSYKDIPHDPNYWWPDDRSWSVCTDIDFNWGYIARTADCIEEVLAVPVLDALATKPANPAHSGTDLVNDPRAAFPRRH